MKKPSCETCSENYTVLVPNFVCHKCVNFSKWKDAEG